MNTKKTLFLSILLLLLATSIHAQTEVIAHRGFWKTDGSAQNSLAALRKADSIRAYGSELDLWITADDVVVVNHDASLNHNGETLSVEHTNFARLREITLANGEPLPTFEEYLDTFDDCDYTKLIIEFKPHKNLHRENLMIEKVIDMVKERGIADRVEYISFSINALPQVLKNDLGAKFYYLSGNIDPYGMKRMGAAGVDYHFKVIRRYPEWVKMCHDLGMKVNVWTVNGEEDMKEMIDLGVDFITTDEPLLLQKILETK